MVAGAATSRFRGSHLAQGRAGWRGRQRVRRRDPEADRAGKSAARAGAAAGVADTRNEAARGGAEKGPGSDRARQLAGSDHTRYSAVGRRQRLPTYQPRTKKMKGFGDGAVSNFHFPKVPPPGGVPAEAKALRWNAFFFIGNSSIVLAAKNHRWISGRNVHSFTCAVSMSLADSRFSSESAPGPFHHGIRR